MAQQKANFVQAVLYSELINCSVYGPEGGVNAFGLMAAMRDKNTPMPAGFTPSNVISIRFYTADVDPADRRARHSQQRRGKASELINTWIGMSGARRPRPTINVVTDELGLTWLVEDGHLIGQSTQKQDYILYDVELNRVHSSEIEFVEYVLRQLGENGLADKVNPRRAAKIAEAAEAVAPSGNGSEKVMATA
jgi:hypothetical protein